MSKLLSQIAKNQSQLEKHAFCQNLIHRQDVSLNAYSFVPHMTFFVLGFKDILETVRIENPKTEIEYSLNAHCEEDSEHWRWFIKDLEKLNMDVEYWGGNVSSILSNLWSSDNYVVREMVYRVVAHIKATHSPEEKMIIIDCLESAFSVFINSLNNITHKNGYYHELKYFGEEHYEDEASHSNGNWLEGEKPEEHSHHDAIQRFRVPYMVYIIDDIFSGFEGVFNRWNDMLADDIEIDMNIAS